MRTEGQALAMKQTLLRLLIILPLILPAWPFDSLAQSQSSTQAARKFDEFGDIYLTDIKARLDNFAIRLQNEPETRGFIIVYRSRRDLPGLSSRLTTRMRNYLVDLRGISAERLVTVDGGIASALVQELWIVPVGATPTPRGDAYSNQFVDTESAWKFDEYYYALPNGVDEYAGDSLEAFAEALRKQPNSQAYIVAYPQYYIERWELNEGRRKIRTRQRISKDRPGTALKMLKEVKADLVKRYRVAPSRIKVVNGGYRKQRQIELWIVPRGEHPPIPTPNAFPKKRR
jgi:hypothetical protein